MSTAECFAFIFSDEEPIQLANADIDAFFEERVFVRVSLVKQRRSQVKFRPNRCGEKIVSGDRHLTKPIQCLPRYSGRKINEIFDDDSSAYGRWSRLLQRSIQHRFSRLNKGRLRVLSGRLSWQ
jgi:hypothetical protein